MESEELAPSLPLSAWACKKIGEHELTAYLNIFENTAFIFIYQGAPRTGSMVMSLGKDFDSLSFFSGRHPDLATAASTLISKQIGLTTIASVYLDPQAQIPVEFLRTLIDEVGEKGKKLLSQKQ